MTVSAQQGCVLSASGPVGSSQKGYLRSLLCVGWFFPPFRPSLLECVPSKVAKARIVLSALLVASVVFGVTARASQSCMTFGEARAAFPGHHLWWHDHHKHCWDANGPARAAAGKTKSLQLPLQRPDKTPMLLYPTLVQGPPADPQLMAGSSMTDGPVLLDVDEVTAEPADHCCWPPLDDEPAASFRERWAAMPVTWLVAHGNTR